MKFATRCRLYHHLYERLTARGIALPQWPTILNYETLGEWLGLTIKAAQSNIVIAKEFGWRKH